MSMVPVLGKCSIHGGYGEAGEGLRCIKVEKACSWLLAGSPPNLCQSSPPQLGFIPPSHRLHSRHAPRACLSPGWCRVNAGRRRFRFTRDQNLPETGAPRVPLVFRDRWRKVETTQNRGFQVINQCEGFNVYVLYASNGMKTPRKLHLWRVPHLAVKARCQ